MYNIVKAWLIATLCLLWTGSVTAQSGWSNFSFERIYLYGQINTPLEKGTGVFRLVFPDLENDINEVARKVIEVLYSSPSDPIPAATTMYYTIYPDGPLSANGSVPPVTKLTLNSEYVAQCYDRFGGNISKVREELVGVLSHELVHTFQARPKNCGEYGVNPVYTSFIEGMADACRYLAGDHSWSKPEVGGHYLTGYTTTGFFLLYLQDNYDPQFIKKFNQSANELSTWSYNGAIKKILGNQYDVDQLWDEYQNTFENPLPEVPTIAKEVTVSGPGKLSSLLNANELSSVTDLTVKGTIDARDFLTMNRMPLLTNLNLKETTIKACTKELCPNIYGFDHLADYIPANAFEEHERLASVVLPANLKGIMLMAFKRCRQMSGYIDLPETVAEIQSVAFEDDVKLKGFISRAITPPILNTNFGSYHPFYSMALPVMTLKVPKGSLSAYQKAEGWKDFGKIEEFDPANVANAMVKDLPETVVNVVGNTIHVQAPLTFVGVSLYDMEGRLISQRQFNHANTADLAIPASDGIRIVKVDYSQGVSESFKVR